MGRKITGTLKNAQWDPTFRVVWGFIYGDTRGRFHDGTRVHTSLVMEPKDRSQPNRITTLNSVYNVEWDDGAEEN